MTEVYDIWLPEKIKTNLMIMAAVAQKHQMLTLTYIRVTSFTDGEMYTLDANGDFTTLESSKEDWLLGLRLLGLIEVKDAELGLRGSFQLCHTQSQLAF